MTALKLQRSAIGFLAASTIALASFSSIAAAKSEGTMPPVWEIEQMIEKKMGADIRWQAPHGRSKHHMKLSGTGTMGDNLAFVIDCKVSYPPLVIDCTVTFEL